jgi:hypothetical protein
MMLCDRSLRSLYVWIAGTTGSGKPAPPSRIALGFVIAALHLRSKLELQMRLRLFEQLER